MSLPFLTFRRATACTQRTTINHTQVRHASLIKRPIRPYTFTQLVTLSDGSTYTTRTTSPVAVYTSTKDTRNHYLWNPSLRSLRNVEDDDAGRLQSFRKRFGRGWDGEETEDRKGKGLDSGQPVNAPMGDLMDLISGEYVGGSTKEFTGIVQNAGVLKKQISKKGKKGKR